MSAPEAGPCPLTGSRVLPPRSAQRLRRAPAQRREVVDLDRAPAGHYPAERAQRTQRLSGHLDGRPGPARELFLRDRKRYADAVSGVRLAVRLAQLDQPRADTSEGVGGGKLGQASVGFAQARAQHGEHREGDLRPRRQEGPERRRRDDEKLDGLDGYDRRRARRLVDQRLLTEQRAGATERENGVTAARRRDRDLDAPGLENEHAVRRVPACHEHLAALGLLRAADRRQLVAVGLRENREKFAPWQRLHGNPSQAGLRPASQGVASSSTARAVRSALWVVDASPSATTTSPQPTL